MDISLTLLNLLDNDNDAMIPIPVFLKDPAMLAQEIRHPAVAAVPAKKPAMKCPKFCSPLGLCTHGNGVTVSLLVSQGSQELSVSISLQGTGSGSEIKTNGSTYPRGKHGDIVVGDRREDEIDQVITDAPPYLLKNEYINRLCMCQ